MGRITVSDISYWSGSTQPKVEYTYSFNGRTYWSDRIWAPSVTLYLAETARRVVTRFPAGVNVPVFVNPQNPAFAVLVPGGDKKFLPTIVAFGTAAFLVALRLIVNDVH
jgi:hypothetical protein